MRHATNPLGDSMMRSLTSRRLGLAAILFLLGSIPSMAAAQSYAVDPIHSTVLFNIRHADTAPFYGRFNKVSGAVEVGDAGAVKSLTVTADAESVDTNNKARDEHLRNPDFFNTKEFPEISFKSTSVERVDEKTFKVTGDLTLLGQARPITITLTHTGTGKNVQGKDIIGYETTFTIKRSEWGMSGYIGKGLGDDVTLIVAIEAIKQ
jgi:polyisoprenoid-binding protein YceI